MNLHRHPYESMSGVGEGDIRLNIIKRLSVIGTPNPPVWSQQYFVPFSIRPFNFGCQKSLLELFELRPTEFRVKCNNIPLPIYHVYEIMILTFINICFCIFR